MLGEVGLRHRVGYEYVFPDGSSRIEGGSVGIPPFTGEYTACPPRQFFDR
jgi:hypothetical protein